MSSYLLTLSIGPVQGFIAAARRSRDLWFGSYLLSEAAKAAAAYLKQKGATLIFPDDPKTGDPDTQISNVILAHVATDDPKALLDHAKDAAHGAWLREADKVLENFSKQGKKIRIDRNLWESQAEDALEFYAAWVAIANTEDAEEAYHIAYKRIALLFEARKSTRDFRPSGFAMFGYQKSSLDGLRESVIPPKIRGRDNKLWARWRRRWGIGDGEELDCLGLVKRVGGKLSYRQGEERIYEHFTPLSRIAADPWLFGILGQPNSAGATRLLEVQSMLEGLISADLVSPVRGNNKIYKDFPYDGQLLYSFRVEAEQSRLGDSPEEKNIRLRLDALREKIRPLWKEEEFGEPCPYLAILRADGDRMGKLLRGEKVCNMAIHQAISKQLSDFSKEARNIVRTQRGHVIYSGGDDVLALLPLDRAVECADKLREKFSECLKDFGNPTLSVGLAIGHFLEPLPVLLDLARRAEKLAKGDGLEERKSRNALGIILKPRSGGEVVMRGPWTTDPAQRLKTWTEAFRSKRLPDRTPYLLREADERFGRISNDSNRKYALKAVVQRIVQRRSGSPTDTDKEQQALQDLREKLVKAATDNDIGLTTLVAELLIARRIAVVARQAKPQSTESGAEDTAL
jgi:CRISPR-associated protein Cmr2